MRVLGIAGSLRAGSFNRSLLRAFQELALPRMDRGRRPLPIPLYNGGVKARGDPEPVAPSSRQSARRARCSLPRPSTTTASWACSKCLEDLVRPLRFERGTFSSGGENEGEPTVPDGSSG
jgi:hypothetical protein